MKKILFVFFLIASLQIASASSNVSGIVAGILYCPGICSSTPYPLSGAIVSAGGNSTISGVDGSYLLDLSPGTYNISYTSNPRYSPLVFSRTIEANTTTEINAVLMEKQTGTITGRVCTVGGCAPRLYTQYNTTESAAAGIYLLHVDFLTVTNVTESYNHTVQNTTFLFADIFTNFSFLVATNATNATNAIVNSTLPYFNITLSNLTISENYSINITQNYNYNLSISVPDQVVPLRSNVSVLFNIEDIDANSLSVTGSLTGLNVYNMGGVTILRNSTVSPHDFGNLSSGLYTYSLGVIEYATTGLNVYNVDGVAITKSTFDGSRLTILDTVESDTQFSIYSSSGAFESSVFSNGSTYTVLPGSHIVQVLPAHSGYAEDPMQIIYVLLAGVGVVFGVIFVFTLLIGWGRIMDLIVGGRI